MAEIRVYVANLGKYNEGELVGAWFTPPIDYDEMKERVGLNGRYEEYAIHDYEAPFEILEYTSIDEINRISELVEDMDEDIFDNAREIISHFGFSGIEDLAEHAQDINFYGCDSMEDLAQEFVEEGVYGEIPERIANYIDYAAIARDLEIDGFYLEIKNGILEYNR